MSLPDKLTDSEREELTRRLYQLADKLRDGATPAAAADIAEFIAQTVKSGWDYKREAA